MNIHITKTYNVGGLLGLRQKSVSQIGNEIGCKEMSLFNFPDQFDSDYELDVRMDGIISALCSNDIVLFQYPSGISPRYDKCLLKHIRKYSGTKIVIWVQESAGLRDENKYSIEDENSILNMSDLLIFSSYNLKKIYSSEQIKTKPYMIQELFDIRTNIQETNHSKDKACILTNNEDIISYTKNIGKLEVVKYDEYHIPEMILKISECSFGFICEDDSVALGFYMAAGIPVVIRSGLSCENYVNKNKLGISLGYFENKPEKYTVIEKCTHEVEKIRNIFTDGLHIKKMLCELQIKLNEQE